MTLHAIPLAMLTKEHVQQLLANRVQEGRRIEYKARLPGNADAEKREFLADATSFANAGGGDILYGVQCAGGLPVSLPGVPIVSLDSAILRLESILRDAVDPRLQGLHFHQIPLDPEACVLLLRLPSSFNSPHMVTFGGGSRFYGRNSRGKYQLDVAELRTAFGASASAARSLREFRVERIAKIKAGETPLALDERPRVVLHLSPLFPPADLPDIRSLAVSGHPICPMHTSSPSVRYNLDGVLFYRESQDENRTHTYLQVFRDLRLEAACSSLIYPDSQNGNYIRSFNVEGELIGAVGEYLDVLARLGALPPIVVCVSFIDVAGFRILPITQNRSWDNFRRPLSVPDLLLPDAIFTEATDDVPTVLRPVFDVLWNAAGWVGCMNYDDSGKRLTR